MNEVSDEESRILPFLCRPALLSSPKASTCFRVSPFVTLNHVLNLFQDCFRVLSFVILEGAQWPKNLAFCLFSVVLHSFPRQRRALVSGSRCLSLWTRFSISYFTWDPLGVMHAKEKSAKKRSGWQKEKRSFEGTHFPRFKTLSKDASGWQTGDTL